MDTSPGIFLPHDIQQYILTFLNRQNWKESRLVCKNWNNHLLAKSKCKIRYCSPDGPVHPLGRRNLNYAITDQRIFRNIYIPVYSTPEGLSKSSSFSHSVQSVWMKSGYYPEVESFVLEICKGVFPNLEVMILTLSYKETEESREVRSNLKFPESVFLPRLKSVKIVNENLVETPSKLAFWQAFINSSPNIRSFESTLMLELSTLEKLEHFVYNGNHKNDLEKFSKMSQSLGSSVSKLELLVYNNITRKGQTLPVLPNVTSFKLSIQKIEWEEATEPPLFLFNMHEIFPSLKICILDFPFRLVMEEMPDLFETNFQNLEMLEILLEWKGKREEEMALLQQLVINNGKLKALKINLDMGKSWFATEECIQHLLGLDVPNLILQLTSSCTVSLLLRFLAQVEVNEDQVRMRSRVLEIRNYDHPWNHYDKCDKDSEKGVRTFASIFRKLERKYAFIRLKQFQPPPNILEIIKEQITSHQLPVEIYYEPSH